MTKLIVFDCDGTLIDSQHVIASAMTEAFTEQGLAVPHRSRLLRYVGLSLPEAMSALVHTADADLVAKLVASYKNAFWNQRTLPNSSAPMYAGARETIESLQAQPDVLLGLATGKSRRGVDRFIEHENFDGVFVTIQTADNAPSKPHPGMLHQAMAETGAHPDDTVMIGDTSFDMEMARSAHVRAIGVTWGYHRAEEMMRAGAHDIVHDFGGLLEHLSPVRNAAVA
ncbi:MAG: HAD-IA family hydrolase [Alphaproteobacteria bacterium]